jgi:hypothetical protein
MEYSQKNKIQTPSLTPPPKALPSPEALENYLCACGSGKALEACCFKTELAHLEKEVLEESEILQLPQKKHAQWEIGRFKLNTWFEDAGHLYRPELLLCSDRETGKRYGVSLLDSYHLPESLQHSLYDTLASPNEGEPHRPALVFFEDPSLLEALQKHLEALQIPFRLEQKLNHLETNRKALQEAMCPETQEWPSLSSSVSLEYFLFLSQKATQFYQKKTVERL